MTSAFLLLVFPCQHCLERISIAYFGIQTVNTNRNWCLVFVEDLFIGVDYMIDNTSRQVLHRADKIFYQDYFHVKLVFLGSFSSSCEAEPSPPTTKSFLHMFLDGSSIDQHQLRNRSCSILFWTSVVHLLRLFWSVQHTH